MEVSIERFVEMRKFKGELGRLILKISTELSMARVCRRKFVKFSKVRNVNAE